MINRITLLRPLPEVFARQEGELHCTSSEIWLREVDFVRPDRYLIEAASGTGKSSLCSYIYGARTDYRGQILFDGTDIATLGISEWCRLRTTSIAYLPQEMRLFPELTALENIEIKNRLTRCKSHTEIMTMMERLEIAGKADVAASRLSVGQQQRVAIIRALCQPFSFLLIDEPVSHLDARNNTIVASLIEEEADRRNASVIATSVGNNINITTTRTFLL